MTRRLVLMTGSHHAHVFWYESGYDKTPAQLQIMYLIDRQRWIPRKSFFMRPPQMEKENELGRWNAICVNCHATHPRSRPDEKQVTWDTRVSDFGITCEACHGPGESHAKFHRQNPNSSKQDDDPIVNPMDMPARTRSDLCGQCHGMMMVSIDDAEDQEKYFADGRTFRPGQSLGRGPVFESRPGQQGTSGRRNLSTLRRAPRRHDRTLLARRADASHRARLHQHDRVKVFSRRRALVHVLPYDAPAGCGAAIGMEK